MVLKTVGKITHGTLRIDLWNAEVRGQLTTEKGTLTFHALVHADWYVLAVDWTAMAGEEAASLQWEAEPAVDPRNIEGKLWGWKPWDDPPNPPLCVTVGEGISRCVPSVAGGRVCHGMAGTAPRRRPPPVHAERSGHVFRQERLGRSGYGGGKAAAENFGSSSSTSPVVARFLPEEFPLHSRRRHREFYWVHMYKLGCATRADRMVPDELGPWFRSTGWPRIWRDLNIQIVYLSVYAANHLELGESLVRFIDRQARQLRAPGREIWQCNDGAAVTVTTDYEGLRQRLVVIPRLLGKPRQLHLGLARLLAPVSLLDG